MNKTAGASCLLEGIGLRKEFPRPEGPLVVLDDSHFQLREKEAVAVVGASGSGKSTFLNILGALDTPTAGELRYRGRPLDTHNQQVVDQWRLARVGFVFQTHMLLPDFTAYENLLLPVRVRGAVPREHRERARRFLGGHRPGRPGNPSAGAAEWGRTAAHRPGPGLHEPTRDRSGG